jgi:hypothetical protein
MADRASNAGGVKTIMLSGDLMSIRALAPLEQGGPVARDGFIYQDHVAAQYCIRMLSQDALREVWCEAEDDITLLWVGTDGDHVELVQVKSDRLDQLWSTALLCEGGSKDSIVAKSLAHDRCLEPCTFRVVTRADVQSGLRVLKRSIGHPEREFTNPVMLALHRTVCERLGDLISPRLRSASHWLADLEWTVAESEDAIRHANLVALDAWLDSIGDSLFSDQKTELYERLLRRIIDASRAKWADNAEKKKVIGNLFRPWFRGQVAEVKGLSTGKAGQVLRRKMEAAGLDVGVIDTAEDLRRRHRAASLDPRYMAPADGDRLEGEAIAALNLLVARLDSGRLTYNGVSFHAACLEALAKLQKNHPGSSFVALQSAMYVAAERCRHRFLPAGA